MTNANLSGAFLTYATLSDADLTGENLTGNADLYQANLTYASLHSADLSGANLSDTELDNAELYAATFSHSTILYDRQTVLQHGFSDAFGLQTYLETYPVEAYDANSITCVDCYPIPEPSTVLLLGLGGVLLAYVNCRRRCQV